MGDQLYFYIGRFRGKGLLEKRPVWRSKSEKVFLLMEKYDMWLILGFRFLYGIRTVTPFLISTGSISSSRFLILNMLGASVWAVVVGTMGYLFGHALEVMIGNIKHYEPGSVTSPGKRSRIGPRRSEVPRQDLASW